jgi:hypothetical protein
MKTSQLKIIFEIAKALNGRKIMTNKDKNNIFLAELQKNKVLIYK